MNKKILAAVFLGILLAAVVCLVSGLILYFTASGMQISSGSPDYEALAAARSTRMIIGLIMIIVGAASSIPPITVFIIMLFTYVVNRVKNKKDINN